MNSKKLVDIRLPLGELEIAVLNVLWAAGESDARAVHERMNQDRKRSLNTILSTLSRLHNKRALRRWKHGRAFRYSPILGREEFFLAVLRSIAISLGDTKFIALRKALLLFCEEE